ncbi:MAG: amidophosphoribosyltransferase, partial [Candidatus Bathyarchaeia archaeon]
NYKELRLQLMKNEICLESRSDAEILVCLLAKELGKSDDPFEALTHLSKMIEGGYAVVCLTGRGELLAFRDPRGLRPLCYGFKDEAFIVASESVAIDMCGGELKGDIRPGEAFLISGRTVERRQFAEPRRAHCMFEYVYFSRPDSVIEGIPVYDARVKLGENLARSYHTNVDVIVPVPDTSRPAAEGASRVSGVLVEEGLIKNRYIHRTFIMPEQRRRETAVKAKLNAMKSVVKGKRVLLIDDSLVRGTTLKRIVNMVKDAGAKEIHVRLTCPPIISPCFYGIDIATHHELIASKNSVEEIRKTIGADSLGYQTLDGLIEAIGLKRDDMCFSCLTGNYQTPKAQEISDTMKDKIATQEERVRYIEVGT